MNANMQDTLNRLLKSMNKYWKTWSKTWTIERCLLNFDEIFLALFFLKGRVQQSYIV